MAYLGTSPSNGVRRRFVYTATANQTSFSGNDDNGTSLVYVDVAYLDVYQNGVKLKSVSDYASTTGTSVVLAQGASVNDIVEIIAFDVFSIGDTVSAADGGNFGGNIGMGGTLAVTGNTTVGGTLAVTGASTLTGALSAKGGVVFNEDSVDVDFRVESNNDANAFVVEGSTGNIGFGIAAPAGDFHLTDAADIRMLFTSDQTGNTAGDGTFIGLTDGGHFSIFNREATSTRLLTSGVVGLQLNSAGIVTMPLQPAFSVFNSALNNIQVATGETVVPFNRESFDRNGNFNSSNYTFTAPVQGTYQLDGQFRMRGLQNDINYIYFNLITTNASVANIFEYSGADDADYHTVQVSLLANMAATHTAVLKVYQSGGAAETDLEQDTSIFSGYLVG